MFTRPTPYHWIIMAGLCVAGCVSPCLADMLYQLRFNDTQGIATYQSTGSVTGTVVLDRDTSSGTTPDIAYDTQTPDQSSHAAVLQALSSNPGLGPMLVMPDSNLRLQLSQSSDEMTIAMWVKWSGPGSNNYDRGLAGKWASNLGWSFSITPQGQLYFMLRTNTAATWSRKTVATLTQDQWTHIAVVIDNDAPSYSTTVGGIRFYINGKVAPLSQGMGAIGSVIAPADTDVVVGTAFSGNSRALNGSLDDVQIHDKALTAAQIHLLYTSQSLRYHISFEDGQGNTTLQSRGSVAGTVIQDTATSGGTSPNIQFTSTTPDNTAYAGQFPTITASPNYGPLLQLPDSNNRMHLSQDGDAMTFAAWVKWDGPGTSNYTRGIIGKWAGTGGWFCSITPAGNLNMNLRTTSASTWSRQTVATLTQGQWTHIAIILDTTATEGTTRGGIQFYINGIMTPLTQSMGNLGSIIAQADTPIIIGANFTSNGQALNGSLDDVRLYDVALSPGDIYTLAGSPGDALDINDYIYTASGKQMIALRDALYLAYAQGNSLTLPSGTYTMDTPGVGINNIQDFTITGAGMDQTTLVLDHADTAALTITGSDNVTIKDLSITVNPIPIVQGTITSITPYGNQWLFNFTTHAGYPTLTTANMAKFHGCSCFFSGTTGKLLPDSGWFGAVAGSNVFRIDDTHGQLLLSNTGVSVGDKIALPFRGYGFPVSVKYSDTTRLENVGILASSSLGMSYRYCGGDNYLKVTIKRAPKPAGATEVPLFSTNADGLNYILSSGTLTLEDCDFGFMGDDGVNISSPAVVVSEVISSTQVRVIYTDVTDLKSMVNMTGAGDKAQPMTYGTFDPLNEMTVSSITYDGQMSGSLPAIINTHYTECGKTPASTWYAATLTFTQPSTDTINVGDYITLRSCYPQTFSITDSSFHDTRARGLLIMASNGLIDNNEIDYTYLPGILMGNEFPFGYGDWVRNVTVSNNTVTNTMISSAIGPDSQALAAIQVGHSSYHRSNSYPWGMGNENVTITNNDIDYTYIAGIAVNGLLNGLVQNNTINQSQLKYGATAGFNKNLTAPYAITIMNSSGVTTGSNVVTNPGPYHQGDCVDMGVYP